MSRRRPHAGVIAVACAAALAACGTGSSEPPSVDVTGTWTGMVDSTDGQGQPVYGTYEATFRLTQSGASVTGNYVGGGAVGGTISAGVSGNRVVGSITPRECRGQLHFSATVHDRTPPTMDVDYEGTTECSGARVDLGTLTKQ